MQSIPQVAQPVCRMRRVYGTTRHALTAMYMLHARDLHMYVACHMPALSVGADGMWWPRPEAVLPTVCAHDERSFRRFRSAFGGLRGFAGSLIRGSSLLFAPNAATLWRCSSCQMLYTECHAASLHASGGGALASLPRLCTSRPHPDTKSKAHPNREHASPVPSVAHFGPHLDLSRHTPACPSPYCRSPVRSARCTSPRRRVRAVDAPSLNVPHVSYHLQLLVSLVHF